MYKHLDGPAALPFLLKGRLKFTPITELNDPSELLPQVNLRDLETSLVRLRRDGYSPANFRHLRQQGALLQRLAPAYHAGITPASPEQASRIIRAEFYNLLPPLLALPDGAAAEMSRNVGILCLTRRFDSLPMWAHYSGNASGLAIEFQGLDEPFAGDETGILRRIAPVRYDREKVGVTFDPRSHETIFFAKSTDWRYEQESRVIMPLDECEFVEINGRRLFLSNIAPRHVRRLILGWRMPLEVAEQIQQLVGDLNPSVSIARARIEKGTVVLED